METATTIALFREAVIQTLLLSAPVLLIGAGVGLVLSILQATTSIQDQTLTFVPKIVAIFGALAYFFPWMLRLLSSYTANLFKMLPQLALP